MVVNMGENPEGRFNMSHFVMVKGERPSRIVTIGRNEWSMGYCGFCWPAFGAVEVDGRFEPVYVAPIETGIAVEV